MSVRQYTFLIAVLLVWVAADAGWVVLGAIAAGLVAIGVVEVIRSDVDLGEIGARLRSTVNQKD